MVYEIESADDLSRPKTKRLSFCPETWIFGSSQKDPDWKKLRVSKVKNVHLFTTYYISDLFR